MPEIIVTPCKPEPDWVAPQREEKKQAAERVCRFLETATGCKVGYWFDEHSGTHYVDKYCKHKVVFGHTFFCFSPPNHYRVIIYKDEQNELMRSETKVARDAWSYAYYCMNKMGMLPNRGLKEPLWGSLGGHRGKRWKQREMRSEQTRNGAY